MSKAKDWWYGNTVAMIRDYPRTSIYPVCERDRQDAAYIRNAIEEFSKTEQGRFTLTIVDHVDWRGQRISDIDGASERSAKRYRRQFIEAVAERVGWRKVGTKTPKRCG